MLSAIITKLTSLSLLDYLRPRLFDPLGIENLTWETDPNGVNLGGTGLHLKVEDIARFGQMYLDRGMWDGKRILSEAWVAEAARATSDNSNTQTNPDWTVGYGYQFWRCRHNCYRGDGAFGQFCLIMPEQDAVLAIISGLRDMQAVLDKVWDHLLPAFQPEALPENPEIYHKLNKRLANLTLQLPEGQPSSPSMGQWSGKRYKLEPNEIGLQSARIVFKEDGSNLSLQDNRGEHVIGVGYNTWLDGTTEARGYGEEPIAACGAWTDEDVYQVRICYYESEFCAIYRFHFMGKELQLEVELSVSWEEVSVKKITGRMTG